MKPLIKNLVFLFFLSCMLHTEAALAQFKLPTIENVKPTISLTSEPITPSSNSTVTVTANLSGITRAGNSNYTWFLNGARQNEASGQNKNTFVFRTGAVGAVYKVGVSVIMPDGENLSDNIGFTASDADLTWITDSRAPITYRAKLMPTQNSIVAVSALPFIYRPGTKTRIGSSNLIYNWAIDGSFDSKNSGLNKSSYFFRISNYFGNSHAVGLEIKTEDGAVSLKRNVTIPVVKPQVLLHFADPKTSQPFGAALKALATKLTNFNFVAQTYFFTAGPNDLEWQWFVNNAKVSGANQKPWFATLDLTNKFSESFSTQIQVTAKNPANELESASSIINLEIK